MVAREGDGWRRARAFAESVVDRVVRGHGARPDVLAAGGEAVLALRMDHDGRSPAGTIAAGGSCRLLRTADGWCAVNLPRPDDPGLLPAWVGVEATDGVPWEELADALVGRTTDDVVADAQVLGLAVSGLPPIDARADDDEQLRARGTVRVSRPWLVRRVGIARRQELSAVRVVNLSALWAGPLCARILQDCGASVTQVDSPDRPDGTRAGDPWFWSRLHDGQSIAPIEFGSPDASDALRALIADADVVIEGSRPRALDHLGIDPEAIVAARPGAVWISITGYGRCGPWRNRVAFGDDAAVAAGLVDLDDRGVPGFVGDAVADPLSGLTAAALALDALRAGGGVVIDVALREVARAAATGRPVVW